MDDSRFEKYNAKRKEIIKQYNSKKLKEVLLTMVTGAAVVALAWILCVVSFINIAVCLVLTAVAVMITVIFARIRVVTVNHIRDEKLRLFEDDDPTFY